MRYSIWIGDAEYFSIRFAYTTFKNDLNKNICYNSFYKHFTRYRRENRVQEFNINVAKLYPAAAMDAFINYLNSDRVNADEWYND